MLVWCNSSAAFMASAFAMTGFASGGVLVAGVLAALAMPPASNDSANPVAARTVFMRFLHCWPARNMNLRFRAEFLPEGLTYGNVERASPSTSARRNLVLTAVHTRFPRRSQGTRAWR